MKPIVARFAWTTLYTVSGLGYWVRRRFTAPGMLLLTALWTGAIFGIDTERSMTYQVFTLLLAVLACALPFAWRFRPQLALQREAPRLATAGEPFGYRVLVRNPADAPQRGLLLRDELADPRPRYAQFKAAVDAEWSALRRPTLFDLWRRLVAHNGDAVSEERALPELPARSTVELRPELTPQRRGVLRFERLTVARPDPFNLIKACAGFRAAGSVLVLPKCYRLPPLALPGVRRYQHGGVALATSVGDSEEFVSLRDYRPGDPPQRVHWKSFARVGHPVVKEYQDEFFERHALALDTFARGRSGRAFEEAVSVAASFVAAVDTRECLLDLLFVGREAYSFTTGRGQLQAQQVLEVLAAVTPGGAGAFQALAECMLASRAQLSSAILVLLDWDDARKSLAERLRASGLPLRVLLVHERPEALDARAPWITVLEPGRVEQGLAGLGRQTT